MRVPGQIWSSSPFCPPECWRSTLRSIIGKFRRLWFQTMECCEVQAQSEGIPAFWVGVTPLQTLRHIILKWFICKILGRNSWLCKILIHLGKQYKVVKGMLTSLFFFSIFTNWFTNYCMVCGDYVCLSDTKAHGGAHRHRLSWASPCQLFLLLGSSCFIWLPRHLN